MSDRTVREIERALVQRIERLEKRVRALALRAWPGAVRTAVGDLIVVPPSGSYDVDFEIVKMTVPPGRWIVFGDTDLRSLPTFTAEVTSVRTQLVGRIVATGIDGVPLSGNGDFPQRSYLATIAATVQFPFAVTADVRYDADINLALVVRDLGDIAWDAPQPRLKAMPV